MRKKLLGKYILLSVPFLCGCLLYGIGSYGIVSSLLFFCGGYVVIKNLFDYRKINKNIKKIKDNDLKLDICNNDNKDELLFDRDNVDAKNMLCNVINENIMFQDVDSVVDDCNDKYWYRKSDNIPGLKRTRVNSKVRRKY